MTTPQKRPTIMSMGDEDNDDVDDDDDDDDVDDSMFFSAIDRGVMAISRTAEARTSTSTSPASPSSPARQRASVAHDTESAPAVVLADTVYARPLRPDEKLWFEGAKKAGMWLVKSDGELLCAYTRGKGVAARWRTDEVYDGARVADVACGPQGHAWVITTDGSMFVSANVEDTSPDAPDTVRVTTYENQRWWVSPRGWSSNMLPSDRPAWSDETGLTALPFGSFELPSARWVWTNNWELITGPHTDPEV